MYMFLHKLGHSAANNNHEIIRFFIDTHIIKIFTQAHYYTCGLIAAIHVQIHYACIKK